MTGIITLVGVEHDSKTPIQTLFEILLKNLLKGYTQLENRPQLDKFCRVCISRYGEFLNGNRPI